uniref:preprotein translocase subunit SecA n=1 Tax=Sargassum polycystum TaxID=127578 RepID=UPI0020C92660|nr:preprotein translocase subunit SecA [Sargassum polycystum]YP_010418268.1 preprotein translocase subunit SecA [Sargassum plagiophyllum]USF18252.1 preprotein translocase subunit SecA [Sargassum polycystum]USF18486.1 preprotein translocase subunit SecA [Sargassum plagiophyllum]
MIKLFSQLQNILNEYQPTLDYINTIENDLVQLSDSELKSRTAKLKYLIFRNNNSDIKIISEAFALTREVSKRTINLRHYDVQILGGLVLNDGKIAEMRTGEGKTLVSTSPAVINALSGSGVHIVTINDYLAKRDAEWMGQIHRSLGLKVGLIQSEMSNKERRLNYSRDITYVTNVDLVFDFLKDNMILNKRDLVQRPFNFCIIDEVDSILIDEARTPLIISRELNLMTEKYFKANEVSKYLQNKIHFEIDEKAKKISLTEKGLIYTKILLKVNNLYSIQDPWIPYILNSLKARYLFFRDIHYILKANQIIIIDEFTGRIMEGRKWGDGLHQAIEAKENIQILKGSETLASITYQNFFRLYPKISGMTGTAKTEELEFENIYNLSVFILPTYKKMIRKDKHDFIFIDEISKWRAIAKECLKMYSIGQPVLVGTTTIQNSEILSQLLQTYNIPHQLLNAKPENIKKEAKIVAQAGCLNSITIATNMAGRGTDILLGGNPEYKAIEYTRFILRKLIEKDNFFVPGINLLSLKRALKKNPKLITYLQNNLDTLLTIFDISTKRLNILEKFIFNLYNELRIRYKEKQKQESGMVKALGGLYVIGTERHESRRIDNQLRGRSGRQGNPGVSRFFLSLNDPLIRIFGGNKIQETMLKLKIDNEILDSKFLSNSLDAAQQKVEGFYYDQRKTLNKYDQVLDKQRKIIYYLREKVLSTPLIRDLVMEFCEGFLDDLIQYLDFQNQESTEIILTTKILKLLNRLSISTSIIYNNINKLDRLKKFLYEQLWASYMCKEFHYSCCTDSRVLNRYNQLIFFKYIDFYWYKHLENMNFLLDAISWEAYAQKDPFLQYDERATNLLNFTLKDCRDSIIFEVFISNIIVTDNN